MPVTNDEPSLADIVKNVVLPKVNREGMANIFVVKPQWEQVAEKGVNGVNKNGEGLIESLGTWQKFPIVFGWAEE